MVRRRPGTRALLGLAGLLAAGYVVRRRRPVPAPRLTVVPPEDSVAPRPTLLAGPDAVPSELSAVPGRPRFYLASGGRTGTVAHGSGSAAGLEQATVLGAGRFMIGRSRRADLRLLDTTVSPEHAEVVVEPDGRTFVRDLDADNGVRVDGVPVPEAELFDGNRLELGTVSLLFHRDEGDGNNARDGFDRLDGA